LFASVVSRGAFLFAAGSVCRSTTWRRV